MATQASELNKLTDDQVEKEVKDLQAKTDATVEEKTKLTELKEERQTRLDLKIKKLHSTNLAEKNRADKLEKELEEQRAELAKIKEKEQVAAKPKIVEDTIEIAGKKFYTDDSLTSMVAAQELTPQQAYAHQQQRMKAEIKDETIRELKGEETKNEAKKTFDEDRKSVLRDYPQFDPKLAEHDPEDPLYKTASEIWVEGYQNNPRGLSLAIKRAKQILRMSDERPDVSNEHSVGRNRMSSESRSSDGADVTLNDQEKEVAHRMYGGIINPATGRNYTEAESIIKATKAKTARMKR